MANFPLGYPEPVDYRIHSELFSPQNHWEGADFTDSVGGAGYLLENKVGGITHARGIDGKMCFSVGGTASLGLAIANDGDFQNAAMTVSFWMNNLWTNTQTLFEVDSTGAVDANDNQTVKIFRGSNSDDYIMATRFDKGDQVLVQENTILGCANPAMGWQHFIYSRSATGTIRGFAQGEDIFGGDVNEDTPVPGSNGVLRILGNVADGELFHGCMQSVMYWNKELTRGQCEAVIRSVGVEVAA